MWIRSVCVVQFDMDDASDCQYIDYYSVYTFNIHVPYLIVFSNQNQALVTLCLHAYLNFIVIYMLPIGGPRLEINFILFYFHLILYIYRYVCFHLFPAAACSWSVC